MANNVPIAVGELIEAATINTWARGYFRKTTSKAVNTTTTATDLLNGEFTLPADAMGTDKVVRLTAWGNWKNGSGSPQDVPTFRLGLGATTLIDTDNLGANIENSSSSRGGWRLVCEIQNRGATNSQVAYLTGHLSIIDGASSSVIVHAFATGNGTVAYVGSSGLPGQITYDGGTTAAVDTTASCALTLKVVNDFNDANYETLLQGALVEII